MPGPGKWNWEKWKHYHSSDSDSVELMTSLTAPISDFNWVVSSSFESDSVASEKNVFGSIERARMGHWGDRSSILPPMWTEFKSQMQRHM